jgi:hypothetical protein
VLCEHARTMCRFVAVVLCLLLSSPSVAWNSFGHMAVAWIAYQHLEPRTKSAVKGLIAKNPSYQKWKSSLPANLSTDDRDLYIFMLASTWADQIKGDGSYHDDGTDGGNTPPSDNSATGNLHSFWDNLLGASSGTPQQAAAVAADLPAVVVSSNDLDVHTWIDESFALAQSVTYANPPVGNRTGPFRYDQTYAGNARAVAQKRVAQAGLRLTNILNTEIH